MRVCAVPGCPNIYEGTQPKCPACTAAARKTSDAARGTATQRGYNTPGHRAFRSAVIRRDPICVLCGTAFSAIADHHPASRKQLIDEGMNPNDPQRGRGLCKPCHDSETAHNQPGGWNQ
jgi:5-methylcytosine-specific restriction protein A